MARSCSTVLFPVVLRRPRFNLKTSLWISPESLPGWPFLFTTLLFLLQALALMAVRIWQEALLEWSFLRTLSLQTVYAVLLLRSRNLLFMAGRIFLESLLKRTFLVTTMLLFLMMLLVLAATLLLPLLPFLVAILFTTMTRSDEGLF